MATPRSKLLPPPVPPGHVARGDEWLAEALRRRLTLVVAGPGFGKSTLLAGWAARTPSAWYALGPPDARAPRLARGLADALALPAVGAAVGAAHDRDAQPASLAAVILEALDESLTDDLLLVLDDLHELPRTASSVKLVQALIQQAPPELHVVIASRTDVPFAVERLRGRGQVLTVDAAQLRFSLNDARRLLAAEVEGSADLAGEVYAVTEGWPAAVRLAVEALRVLPPEERAAALARAARPGGALYGYLAEEVLRAEPESVRPLLDVLAPLDRFTEGLCAWLGFPDARSTLDSLARRGLFLDAHGEAEGWMRLHALVREAVLQRVSPEDARAVLLRAAEWFEGEGFPEDALGLFVRCEERDAVGEFLRRKGEHLIQHGAFDAIVEAAPLLPEDFREASTEAIVGDAYHCLGDDETGRRWLERARGHASELSPDVRFRLGLLHAGQPREALAVWDPEELLVNPGPRAGAMLTYSALDALQLGDLVGARRYATGARELQSPGSAADPEATTVMGAVEFAAGDTATAVMHFETALAAAEEHGFATAAAHALMWLASAALAEGRPADAIQLAQRAKRTTRLAIFLAWAGLLRGRALFLLGRLDEALVEVEAARSRYARSLYAYAASGYNAIGDVQRERGRLTSARAAYERARDLADDAGLLWDLAAANEGLARVLAFEEPGEAARLAGVAAELVPPGPWRGSTAATRAWVALAADDREGALASAAEASADARRYGTLPLLAEMLELQGLAERADGPLREALALWHEMGSELGAARVELELAALHGSASAMEQADRRLRELGVQPDAAAGAAGPYASLPGRGGSAVSIRTLGGFRLLRGGEPVPHSEWQSRKARDLLKILVAHRGRPVPRDGLMEALWPEGDPDVLANRLSVLLATVRGVLDPERAHPSDRFVQAKGGAVSLDLSQVDVDVERFLELAGRGDFAAAEVAYGGDFLEEDLYEDWAGPLRDEARETYLAVVRELSERATDADVAVRYLQRILEHDPYDEAAHLRLVSTLRAAGRHGEARRRYLTYTRRMDEIGVEPAPLER